MIKFISGAIVGAAVASLGFYLIPHGGVAPSLPVNETKPEDQSQFMQPWDIVGSSDQLAIADALPIDDPRLAPYPAADVPILALKSEVTLGTASRGDIQRVCLAPVRHHLANGEVKVDAFNVLVWLTPDARKNLGAAALAQSGTTGVFTLIDQPVARFQTDAHHVQTYLSGGSERDISDFSIRAQTGTTFAVLSYAKTLAGSGELEACTTGTDLDIIPGFTAHKAVWQEWLAKYPDLVKTWQENYGTN